MEWNWNYFLRGVLMGIMIGVWSISPLLNNQNPNSALGFLGASILIVIISYYRERKIQQKG